MTTPVMDLLREAREALIRATNNLESECIFCGADATPDGDRHAPGCIIARLARVPSAGDGSYVRIPTSESEAAAMVVLGTEHLKRHAPHRLNQRAAVGGTPPDAAALKRVVIPTARRCGECGESSEADWVAAIRAAGYEVEP